MTSPIFRKTDLLPQELHLVVRKARFTATFDEVAIEALKRGLKAEDVSCLVCNYSGNLQVLKLLLNAKPDLSCEYWVSHQYELATALHYAARLHTADHVRCLIQHGANVNQLNTLGETPLMHAAGADSDSAEKLEIIRVLLDLGADVSIKNLSRYRKGWTAIDYAKQRGRHRTVQILQDALSHPRKGPLPEPRLPTVSRRMSYSRSRVHRERLREFYPHYRWWGSRT
jgi:Ankyrin repeats (3 copies)